MQRGWARETRHTPMGSPASTWTPSPQMVAPACASGSGTLRPHRLVSRPSSRSSHCNHHAVTSNARIAGCFWQTCAHDAARVVPIWSAGARFAAAVVLVSTRLLPSAVTAAPASCNVAGLGFDLSGLMLEVAQSKAPDKARRTVARSCCPRDGCWPGRHVENRVTRVYERRSRRAYSLPTAKSAGRLVRVPRPAKVRVSPQATATRETNCAVATCRAGRWLAFGHQAWNHTFGDSAPCVDW